MKKKVAYTRRIWTEEEIQTVRGMFADNYTIDICKILNRKYGSVANQASIMGLKKSDAFRKVELQKQADRLRSDGASYRFPKGHVPKNKGKAMPAEVYKKVKATMFKKGSIPPNVKYDGHERISKDGYIEIRIAPGKYVLKHRYLYEQKHGKIPDGFLVVFKDRNPLNIELANLEMISMAENMIRNQIHRYPPELKSTIRVLNKLNRIVNEKRD